MSKLKALALIGIVIIAADGFALKNTSDFAFGAEATCVNLDTFGAMLTLHLPGIPLFIGIGADFYHELSGELELTGTIDYWLLHSSGGFINLYLGFGLYGAMTLEADWYIAGLRLPIGLQVWPLNNEKLEMFLEVAPAWVPLQTGEWDYEVFQAQLALGLRFWFETGR